MSTIGLGMSQTQMIGQTVPDYLASASGYPALASTNTLEYLQVTSEMSQNSAYYNGGGSSPGPQQQPPQRKISETVLSGQFMISELEEEDKAEASSESEKASSEKPPSPERILEVEPVAETEQKYSQGQKTVTIDASLSKLFQCMTLAYTNGSLTSPRWKNFKGLQLTLKDKIRLNNIIWREWHIQYIMGRKTAVCQFSINVDKHNRPEAQVLEGKYWKRRTTSVTAEYKKWRLYYKHKLTKPTKIRGSFSDQSDLFQCSNSMPGFDDLMDFTDTTLFSSLLPNMVDFPNPREIARSGCGADLMQPGLTQLQPAFDDFMDFEPFQELIMSSRVMNTLATVPEEMPDMNDPQKMTNSLFNQKPIQQESPQTQQLQQYDNSLKPFNNVMYQQTSNLVDNYQKQPVSIGTVFRSQQLQSQQTQQQYSPPNIILNEQQTVLNQPISPAAFDKQNKIRIETMQPALTLPVQKEAYDVGMAQPSYLSYDTTSSSPVATQSAYRNIHYAPYTTSSIADSIPTTAKMMSSTKAHFAVPKLPLKSQRHRSRSASGPQAGRTISPSQGMSVVELNSNLRPIAPHPPPVERTNSLPIYGRPRTSNSPVQQQPPTIQLTSDLSHSTSSLTAISLQPPLAESVSLVSTFNQSPNLSSVTSYVTDQSSNSLIAQLLSSNTPVTVTAASVSSYDSQQRQYTPPSPQPFTFTAKPMLSEYRAGRSVDDTFIGPKVPPLRKISSPGRICTTAGSSPVHVKPDSPGGMSPSQMTLFTANLKGIKQKSDQEKYKEHRRVCHINAEQKRRCNIKNGFDTLRAILPSVSQNANTKISKAAMLQKAAEYIRQLKADRKQQQEDYDIIKKQIESLNQTIGVFHTQLPVTGAPIACQRTGQTRELFDNYVRERTQQNWKFWIFSIIMMPLLESYDNTIATTSLDEMCKSMMRWLDQSCNLVNLRREVLNSLRALSTSTSILNNPASLPEEALAAVMKKNESPSS